MCQIIFLLPYLLLWFDSFLKLAFVSQCVLWQFEMIFGELKSICDSFEQGANATLGVASVQSLSSCNVRRRISTLIDGFGLRIKTQ